MLIGFKHRNCFNKQQFLKDRQLYIKKKMALKRSELQHASLIIVFYENVSWYLVNI